ncbi:MAG: hypothetical protein V4474_00195 [Patescibacteria group bacterium]
MGFSLLVKFINRLVDFADLTVGSFFVGHMLVIELTGAGHIVVVDLAQSDDLLMKFVEIGI